MAQLEIYEFLLQKENPVHIGEIWKHVEFFRGTTYARSILDNLKADESNRFRFMEGSFIGLKNKAYDLSLLKLKRLNGSHFTLKALSKYNGWIFNEAINHYAKQHGYQPIQVEYIIQNKIDEGEIELTTTNHLRI